MVHDKSETLCLQLTTDREKELVVHLFQFGRPTVSQTMASFPLTGHFYKNNALTTKQTEIQYSSISVVCVRATGVYSHSCT